MRKGKEGKIIAGKDGPKVPPVPLGNPFPIYVFIRNFPIELRGPR